MYTPLFIIVSTAILIYHYLIVGILITLLCLWQLTQRASTWLFIGTPTGATLHARKNPLRLNNASHQRGTGRQRPPRSLRDGGGREIGERQSPSLARVTERIVFFDSGFFIVAGYPTSKITALILFPVIIIALV